MLVNVTVRRLEELAAWLTTEMVAVRVLDVVIVTTSSVEDAALSGSPTVEELQLQATVRVTEVVGAGWLRSGSAIKSVGDV